MTFELQEDQLRIMAESYPGEVAYRNLETGDHLTFEGWWAEANRFARGLEKRGIEKGHRVGIYLDAKDILRGLVGYCGVHKAGAVCVPINNRFSVGELEEVLVHADVGAVLVSPSLLENLERARDAAPALGVIVVSEEVGNGAVDDWGAFLDADGSEFQVPVVEGDLADIMYTSGTTGMAKGVAVRHSKVALLPNGRPEWNGSGWLHSAPLSTITGVRFIFSPMKTGMTGLYLPKFDSERWLRIVESERPGAAFIVPAMAELLITTDGWEEADLSSLFLVTLGSAPLAESVCVSLQEKMPEALILNSYGMTESGRAVFSMDAEGARTRPGSVGKPRPPVEVRIVDGEDQPLPVGEVGEVITRDPEGQLEYYRNPDATENTWRDGWLRSGDLGYLDEDGYLFIAGRKKEMIVRGGYNVYPNEVEAVLLKYPEIREAGVLGVPHDVLGEDVAAFVVTKGRDSVLVNELREFCSGHLADYKIPRRVWVVDELPRNAAGKILKRELEPVAMRLMGKESVKG